MLDKEEFIKTLGKIIRKARNDKGISIEDLAFKSKISYSTISCLERGKVGNLQIYNFYKLVKILDINPNLIFNQNQNPTEDKITLINKISSLEDGDLKIILESLKKLTN
ncbi:helix-turn-helix domain-containing protein [Rickettsiales bacterium]|nr:helix-turn-helix domain-containing protein [Rickettsiales bacterium]